MEYEVLKATFPFVITAVITILGWFAIHRLSVNRDRENKRKDLIIGYLIDAWRRLEYAANREEYNRIDFIEKPLADIQLFGSPRQVNLAQKLIEEMVENNEASLNEMLVSLRGDLRKELKIRKVPDKIVHLRIKYSQPKEIKP